MVAIVSEGNILPEGSTRYKEFALISEIVGSVRSKVVTGLGAEYPYTGIDAPLASTIILLYSVSSS